MTGILIDPKAREIREVEIEKDENGSYLTAMYRELDCELVDAAPEVMSYLPGHPADDLWFDDEGRFRADDCGAFRLSQMFYPIVGRGLILGSDKEGNSISHRLTPKAIEFLKNSVEFMTREEAGV